MATSVWLYGPFFEPQGVIRDAALGSEGYRYTSLTYTLRENSVTSLEVVMPRASVPPRTLLRVDTLLGVWYRGRLEGDVLWFVRAIETRIQQRGVPELVLYAEHALSLLARRIVAYSSGTRQGHKRNATETLLKEIVAENAGSSAPADRQLARFRIASDGGSGPTLEVTIARRNVLLVCQEIARVSAEQGVAFFLDVVFAGGAFEFRTYLQQRGMDRGWASPAPLVLSYENGGLAEVSRRVDYRDERTVVYCGGQGVGHQRQVAVAVDSVRAVVSGWNRRELWIDARHVRQQAALVTEANAALWRRRPTHRITAVSVDRPGATYGVDYGYGDVLLVEHMGEVYQGRVHDVTVTAADGMRRVVLDVAVDGGESEAVGRIDATLDMFSSQETARSDDVLMQEILQDNATYAWFGQALVPGATGDWVDVVAGLPATATGNPHTVGMTNGRRAVQFNGSQWFRTAAFPAVLPQPTAIVTVSRRTGTLSATRVLHDQHGAPSSHYLAHLTNAGITLFAGTSVTAPNVSTTDLLVTVATFNRTSSSLRMNGATVVSGNAGSRSLAGLTIGASWDNVTPFIGQMALVAIVNGANYAARAGTIEAWAMAYYGIPPGTSRYRLCFSCLDARAGVSSTGVLVSRLFHDRLCMLINRPIRRILLQRFAEEREQPLILAVLAAGRRNTEHDTECPRLRHPPVCKRFAVTLANERCERCDFGRFNVRNAQRGVAGVAWRCNWVAIGFGRRCARRCDGHIAAGDGRGD